MASGLRKCQLFLSQALILVVVRSWFRRLSYFVVYDYGKSFNHKSPYMVLDCHVLEIFNNTHKDGSIVKKIR